MIDSNQTVATLLLQHAECATVLQRHRIAIGTSEARSLDELCRQRGLDVAQVVRELEAAIADGPRTAAVAPETLSDIELVNHIVARYHAPIRQQLPFLRGLSAKVAHVHSARHPELRRLVHAVYELDDVLTPHLEDEEACLFLAVRTHQAHRPFVRQWVGVMGEEHAVIRGLLARIHDSADGYRVPEGACASYRLLFRELERLERDLTSHLRLEDEVLVPRLLAA
jgi:regulator of cell morphogenesis and NO signaling